MQAVRLHGSKDVRYEDVPEPVSGPGKIKIRVHYSGICGSDLHAFESGLMENSSDPVIMGHEYSGIVVETGAGVNRFQTGDRVAGDGYWSCGICNFCTGNRPNLCMSKVNMGFEVNGSFAEFLVAPAGNFYKLPDAVPDDIGALIEPLEVAFHAVKQSKLKAGDTAVILGAGTIGCGIILAACVAGASRIIVTEPFPLKRGIAVGLGATTVINPADANIQETVLDLTGGLGADITFDCVGSRESLNSAIELTRRGGSAIAVGLFMAPQTISSLDLILGEKRLIGSIQYVHEAIFILDLIEQGQIKPEKLITGRIELKDIVKKGFEELIKNRGAHLKILVESPNWNAST